MSDLIKRRDAIKKTTLLLGAGTLAPSLISGILSGCRADKGQEWTPQALSKAEISLVEEWIDIIIPATETPSASQLMVHRFIDKMIGDFLAMDDVARIKAGLDQLRSRGFGNATVTKKSELVKEMSTKQEWQPFFILMKSLTLLGYFTTETGVKDVLNYDPIPGEYQGCIPLDKYGGKVWAT